MPIRDELAPKMLLVEFSDATTTWGNLLPASKVFSTGSVGFFGSGKITNPKNGLRYQVTLSMVLIGSKDKE